MAVYLVYFAVGVALTVAGVAGYALADRFFGPVRPAEADADDPGSIDATAAFVRASALFLAFVGIGGTLFGGIGVLIGVL